MGGIIKIIKQNMRQTRLSDVALEKKCLEGFGKKNMSRSPEKASCYSPSGHIW
jgi:hypothetical protein